MHKKNIIKSLLVIVMLLFINGYVKSQNINHWEMVVAADDTWHYFLGNSEPPSNWGSPSFDPSSWLSGPGGIGYGDNDDGTVISQVSSVFIRINFNLSDISNISSAVLHVNYDDAFVAYLNDHEIARANIGTVGVRPAYSDFSVETHEAMIPTGGIPERFIIHKDTLAKYMIEGDNVLALQIHNSDAGSSDLSSTTYFSVGIIDASTNYRSVPAWFNNPLDEKTNLPILAIDTWGQTIVDDPKITAWLKVIDNGAGELNNFMEDGIYQGYIGIEIRGQSSQMFPKKSFGFETRDEFGDGLDVSLLGMPAEEDWVLYAPYSDKTMLRNAITYHLGRKMGAWQPRFKFCEVYLNGSYHGVYLLIEKIKRGSDRVDINKLKPDEISGDDLTGGYIVKVDKIQDLTSDEYFYTHPENTYGNARNYAFTYVYPDFDEIVQEQKDYMYDYLQTFENTLNGSEFDNNTDGYTKYIDVNSFIDFQIINELSNNVDGYRYSTYFYKKKDSDGGKLYAGPLWDFNLGYGNVDYSSLNLATDEWSYPNYGPNESYPMHWWARLMNDETYHEALVERWESLRQGAFRTDSIMAYLNDTIAYLNGAIARNFERWPVLGEYVWPNYFVGTTYEQEIDYMKTWITKRLNWMDANISIVNAIADMELIESKISVFPNPVKEEINISFLIRSLYPVDIEMIDLQGRKVFRSSYYPAYVGKQTISFDVPQILQGYYVLKVSQQSHLIDRQKVIVVNH